MAPSLFSWKVFSFGLILFIFAQSAYWYAPDLRFTRSRLHFASPLHRLAHVSGGVSHYHSTLSSEQCDRSYPRLYESIYNVSHHWTRSKSLIKPADIETSWRGDAVLRILVHGNELRILETKGTTARQDYMIRSRSVLNQIHRTLVSASAIGEMMPTFEAAITVDDMSLVPDDDRHTVWTFASRYGEREWLIPDFNFWSAPPVFGSFQDFKKSAQQYGAAFADKIPKVVWRGVVWTNEAVRASLVNVTNGTSWADVEVMDWETKSNMMAMDEMCKYAFLVHTEGRSYSGRLEFLLMCDSLPLVHDLEWTTHYQHLLTPDGPEQNYVRVARDFSDLEDTVRYYLDHPDEASAIIARSTETFRDRYLTPAAESCYWRRLFTEWSEVSFTPDPYVQGSNGQLRGLSFEEFV